MIHCDDCEFCEMGPHNKRIFKCDPFSTIKEPECLQKWQLIRLDMLVASHQGMQNWYNKMAPMQDKLFDYMQREMNDIDDSDRWKIDAEEDDPPYEDPTGASKST